jgi:hypothetical protein
MTREERFLKIKSCNTLELGVFGKSSNIRIWTGCNKKGKYPFIEHDSIFIRGDIYNKSSFPLTIENLHLFEERNHLVLDKIAKYGFPFSITKLEEILDLTICFKQRACLPW